MNKILILLTLLFLSCAKKNDSSEKWNQKSLEKIEGSSNKKISDTQSNKFLDFLNNYQVDSLNYILADNYHLKYLNTFSDDIDKKTFLGEYLRTTKIFNGKYYVIKKVSESEPQKFLIEDQSDYLKYLKVNFPVWKMTIKKDVDSKIEEIEMDTTAGYKEYGINIQTKERQFNDWLKKKIPRETLEILHNEESLLVKRLKQYS